MKIIRIKIVLALCFALVCSISANSEVHKEHKKTNHTSHHHHKTHSKLRKFMPDRHTVKIGHKQYVVQGNSSFSKVNRNSRVINIADNWEKIPFILQTYNEPDEFKYYLMPALSNGFLGTTAKNHSVYMNGLYNGAQSRSHRVRLPSLTSIEAYFPIDTAAETVTYNFDCRRGAYIIETKTNYALMTQRFYVHRRLKNIVVNEIRVELTKSLPVTIKLYNRTTMDLHPYTYSYENVNRYSYYSQKDSYENVTYEHRVVKHPSYYKEKKLEFNDGIYYLSGRIPETEEYGKQQKQVYMFYTNVPSEVVVFANTTVKHFHFIQAIDSDSSRAQKAYEEALRMIQQDQTMLYVTHVAAWEDIWSKSGISMLTDITYTESTQEAFKLAQRLYVSFYNIYAAIPMTFDSNFYGVSPAGLAYGSIRPEYYNVSSLVNRQVSEAYGGHVMYNQELWILPFVSLFSTDMSKNIIHSRLRRGYNFDSLNVFEKAREWAKNDGAQGLRYAWEQGDYGGEASSLQDAKNKIHTTGDISFGLRTYMRTIQAREFLMQPMPGDVSIKGEDYVLELAKYWFEKLQLDSMTNKYGIRDVSFGEKSRGERRNNEAYTNYMAAESLDTYKYALLVSDRNPYDTQYSYITRDFDDKIERLRLPYDELKNLILEYDDFIISHQNEETFVPFLNFPLQKQLTYREKKLVYDTYGTQLPTDGKNLPSYASFLVGHIELNEEPRARDYLGRMSNHFSGPFQVLSEYPHTNFLNPQNTFNYLPGYAAFAHSFIAAYSGIRVQDFQLDIVYPSEFYNNYLTGSVATQNMPLFKAPVPNVDAWNVTGVNFGGNKLDFIYSLRSRSLEIRNRRPIGSASSGEEMLEVIIYEGTEVNVKPLRIGDAVKIGITTEAWKYAPKSRRQFRSNLYSENLNILVSIYSTNRARYLQRMSNSNRLEMKFPLLLLLITFVQFIFLQHL